MNIIFGYLWTISKYFDFGMHIPFQPFATSGRVESIKSFSAFGGNSQPWKSKCGPFNSQNLAKATFQTCQGRLVDPQGLHPSRSVLAMACDSVDGSRLP